MRRAPRGFSVTELMIALSIFVILIVLIVPQFRRTQFNTALRGDVSRLQAFLAELRSDASAKCIDVSVTAVHEGGGDQSLQNAFQAAAGTSGYSKKLILSREVSLMSGSTTSFTIAGNGQLRDASTGQPTAITLTIGNSQLKCTQLAMKSLGAATITDDAKVGLTSNAGVGDGAAAGGGPVLVPPAPPADSPNASQPGGVGVLGDTDPPATISPPTRSSRPGAVNAMSVPPDSK